jgi:hypothetical protein
MDAEGQPVGASSLHSGIGIAPDSRLEAQRSAFRWLRGRAGCHGAGGSTNGSGWPRAFGNFDLYTMDCYRHLAEDATAENLADDVIQASTDFDGTERAPMRLAEARVTLGVVAARQGDLEHAVHYGEQALHGQRRSLPSLMMVRRDLIRVLKSATHLSPPEGPTSGNSTLLAKLAS